MIASRFRLLLNDGEYSNSFAMLATQVKLGGQSLDELYYFFASLFSQLNHLVHEEALPQYTVIKVKKLVCNQMANQVCHSRLVFEPFSFNSHLIC